MAWNNLNLKERLIETIVAKHPINYLIKAAAEDCNQTVLDFLHDLGEESLIYKNMNVPEGRYKLIAIGWDYAKNLIKGYEIQ